MKIKDKTKLAELNQLIGKMATYKTARGKSLPHIIESIEINNEKVIFILRQKHKSFVKRRDAKNVELVRIKENKLRDYKVEMAEIKEQRKEKKKEKQEEADRLNKLMEETDRLNKLEIERAKENQENQEY